MSSQQGIEIHSFLPSQWKTYRQLRLAALEDAPSAFGTLLVDASTFTDQQWQDRLGHVDLALNFPMLGMLNDSPVAMGWVTISIEARNTLDISANLLQMWTAPEARGKGIGKALIAAAVAWCRERQVTTLELHVTEGNLSAEKIYADSGFTYTGRSNKLRETSDLRVRHMILPL